MANVQKYGRNATGHLFAHFERKKDKNGDYIRFGNQDIDTSKTHLNYNLAPHRNQTEYLQQRLSEVHCMKRADVNVMCSWVITKPKDLPGGFDEQFFQASYDFLKNQYGEENIISSYVHLDETTPHMHFSFIPVTFDIKKERYKVSAKDVVNRKHLQGFHKALEHHLSNALGFEVNMLNEVTKEGNRTIDELKRETAIEELAALNEKIDAAREVDFKIRKIENTDISIRGLFQKRATMPVDDWEDLKKSLKNNTINAYEYYQLLEECEYHQDRSEDFENKLQSLHSRWVNEMERKRNLERENAKMKAFIKSKNLEHEYQNFNIKNHKRER